MSSQIESFSELLKSTLTVTHISTDARGLTLYLESRDVVGSIYPKAHIHWSTQHPNREPYYLYFDEEIVLNTMGRDIVDGFKFKHEPGNRNDSSIVESSLLHSGRRVGQMQIPALEKHSKEDALKRIEAEVQSFSIQTTGALECWQSRAPNHRSVDQHTYINVPIFSQSTIIGVLQSEVGLLGENRSLSEIIKLQGKLRDLTVSIGQPLRKEQLYEQATKDPMTGMFNKALYQQQLHDHFHRCQRFQRPLAYVFLDIDHFKNINDSYGHLTGDLALKAVARIMMDSIRQSDIAFRFGGEELCVLLPESNEADGYTVAEKIRKAIEDTDFPTDKDFTIKFTASLGVACTNTNMRTPEELAKAADESVYAAKRGGRNQVVLHSQLPGPLP
jgi:diguanylate cyclase (GGDEF)-like protein